MKQDFAMSEIKIRLETKEDYPVVENMIREAFWNVNVPRASVQNWILSRKSTGKSLGTSFMSAQSLSRRMVRSRIAFPSAPFRSTRIIKDEESAKL